MGRPEAYSSGGDILKLVRRYLFLGFLGGILATLAIYYLIFSPFLISIIVGLWLFAEGLLLFNFSDLVNTEAVGRRNEREIKFSYKVAYLSTILGISLLITTIILP